MNDREDVKDVLLTESLLDDWAFEPPILGAEILYPYFVSY